jgi:error-prone DNA polymerase
LGTMEIRRRYQRATGVTHLIAEHLIDLSDLLRSVGHRDSPFRIRHGRGNEAKIGTRDRVRDGRREIVDAPPSGIPEQRAEMPAIPVATFDFR